MTVETITLRMPRWLSARDRLERAAMAAALFVLARLVVRHGYLLELPPPLETVGLLFERVLMLLFFLAAATRLVKGVRERGSRALGGSAFDLLIVAVAVARLPDLYPALALVLLREAILALSWLRSTAWAQDWLRALQTTPERLLLLSFSFLILVGTFLLMLPAATAGVRPAHWHEALFTAVSAACVTGLVVVDTASYFSIFGQCVILSLMQIGGLGIMTLSTAAALLLGRRLGFGQRRALQSLMEEESGALLRRSIRFIVIMTFSIEAVGFLALWLYWWRELGRAGHAAYLALFHSVSAFCNAGFALFSDSLMGHRDSLWLHLWIGGLIVAGGLGFMVVAEFSRRKTWQALRSGRWPALSLHSRLVLIVTAALLVIGTIAIFFLEFDNALDGLPLGGKILASAFQSVTLRTAGFNTIDIGSLKSSTYLLMIVWMWIGASPGSTGGGIKTSTLMVLLLLFRSLLRGRPRVEVFGRTIETETVNRAIVVSLASGIIVVGFLLLFLWLEPGLGFNRVLFESVSAFGTVGLSTGITPQLGVATRVLLAVLMLAGRLGPLTLALAVGRRRQYAAVRYPEGKVIVG